MSIVGPEEVSQIVAAIACGKVVAIPTDTVYGLAVRADDVAAIKCMTALKRRAEGHPFQLLIDPISAVLPLLAEPATLDRVRAFWPGPLTAVVRARPGTAITVVTAEGTVGVRQPAGTLTRSVIRAAGGVLAATSANISGALPATSADEVTGSFGEEILVLDDGKCVGFAPSTVVDLTKEPPVLLRAGPITAQQLGIT